MAANAGGGGTGWSCVSGREFIASDQRGDAVRPRRLLCGAGGNEHRGYHRPGAPPPRCPQPQQRNPPRTRSRLEPHRTAQRGGDLGAASGRNMARGRLISSPSATAGGNPRSGGTGRRRRRRQVARHRLGMAFDRVAPHVAARLIRLPYRMCLFRAAPLLRPPQPEALLHFGARAHPRQPQFPPATRPVRPRGGGEGCHC
mmetsp:Transcript_926/g.1628  ORF Transcript_926/g.1628 Transcript_926/m.1628 type:complete len:200 (-) Transcript_926:674-1273(-)